VGQANPLGYGLVLLSIFTISGLAIYTRKFMRDLDTFDVSSIRILVAALAIMPLSALFVGIDLQGVNGMGYLALGYAALVGTFAFMLLSFYNIQRFGATAESMTLYVIPVVSGLGGVLMLGEQITAGMVTGVGLIAVGITLINRPDPP
jgi:drug/metabolite transporter (DMT)-like permease